MSVILEALQKAHVTDAKVGPAATRVVDVAPPRGVKLRPTSPAQVVWLLTSLLILGVVAAAGITAFYWIVKHRDQFTFGVIQRPVTEQSSLQAQPPQRSTNLSELPQPVALETVKAIPVLPSQVALPPPPVVGQLATAGTAAPASQAVQRGGQTVVAVDRTPAAPFSLGTILCGDGNDCSAMINGRTVHRGEMVKEHKVLEITPTEVRLQRGNEPPVVLSLAR
jgi:hypothetical protein